jgi:shikimate kinase
MPDSCNGIAAPIDDHAAPHASYPSGASGGRAARQEKPAVGLHTTQTVATTARAHGFAPARTIVLVGLMGAGKTKIGRRLATRLNLPFFDSDIEIESAAGETIEEIFRNRGEAVFRDGERRVIARLLTQPVHVLATGGGAFMDPATRDAIRRHGISVWLRADLDVLFARVSRRTDRPLLQHSDPRGVLATLIERRHPIYAEADLVVDSGEGPVELTTSRVIAALAGSTLAQKPPGQQPPGAEIEI